MARRRTHHPLSVFMNGRLVGRLDREASGRIRFCYADEWLAWEHTLPISLSLPLTNTPYSGQRAGVVFENLLPDSDPIRRKVAERVGAEGTDAYSLLAEIGRDCIGALQFLPEGEEPQPLDRITGTPLDEQQIESLLANLRQNPLGIRRDHDFRISVAGAQEKTALLFHNGQWFEPSGTTPTTHILKPQIGRLSNGMDLTNSVENEYVCLKLLEAFGLPVAKAEIMTFGEQKALVVERFDRQWTKDGRLIRLPQEDLCQALSIPPTRKYQNEGGPGIISIMDTLRGSDDAPKDRQDFFTAVVLFWLIGATDGHAKNFSLRLFPGGRFRLTPFYDVMTLLPSVMDGQLSSKEFRLAMHMGKSRHYRVGDIVGRHVVETGVQAGLSEREVREMLGSIRERATDSLNYVQGAFPTKFSAEILRAIDEKMASTFSSLTDLSF